MRAPQKHLQTAFGNTKETTPAPTKIEVREFQKKTVSTLSNLIKVARGQHGFQHYENHHTKVASTYELELPWLLLVLYACVIAWGGW